MRRTAVASLVLIVPLLAFAQDTVFRAKSALKGGVPTGIPGYAVRRASSQREGTCRRGP